MATDTQTVIQREAPEIEAYKIGLMEQAKDLAGKAPSAEQIELLKKRQLGLSDLQKTGLSQLQSQIDAGAGIGGYEQYLTDADATLDDAIAASGLSTGAYDTSMTQDYMNPYQQAVTQSAIDQMNKQYGVQKTGRDAQAFQSGAFGGSRSGVLEALAQGELADVSSKRIFEDLARNYSQAQAASMSAFENQQRRQAGQASFLSDAALKQAGLGELAQKQGITDIDTMFKAGQVQQVQREADELARLEGERFAYLEPQQRLSYYSDILRGAPSTQQQTLVGGGQAEVPLWQQLAGAGITGLGIYQGTKGLFG